MLAMERAVLPCIFMLVVFHHFGVRVGVTQSPEASFNDPRCNGEMVCPNTPLLFTCTVTGSLAASARVTLPSGPAVAVTNMNMTEVIDGPLPDGVNISSHNVVGTGPVNYSLTLSIERADILTDMAVICDAQTFTPMTDEATCPVATGQPGLPMNPSQNESANTESSAEIQWQHPVETGGRGISISSYTVNVFDDAGHQILSTSVSGNVSTFNITGLEYNRAYNAEITAINSCGFSSPAATLTVMIKARAPPHLSEFFLEFSCDVTLEDPIPVTVNWMYGPREVGVVYPGEQSFSLVLSPTNYPCVRESATTCTAHIARDELFNITITQTNDIGSTVDQLPLDARVLTVETQVLSLETQQFNITVRRNSQCPETSSPVLVTFGARPANGGECVGQQNATARPIPPGATASFFVDAGSISLGSEEALCYVVTLNGVTVVSGDSGVSTASDCVCGEQSGLSAGAAAGIAVAVAVLAAVPVGVALGCCGMWFLMRSRGKRALHGNQEKREKQKEMVELYDDPDRMKTEFSVSNNQAYGQIGTTAQ